MSGLAIIMEGEAKMAFISKVLSLIIAAVTALCGFLFPPNVEVPQVAEGQVRILSFNVR